MPNQYPFPTWPPKFTSLSLAQPAAGSNASIQISLNRRLWPVSLDFTLITDANVAARLVRIGFGATGTVWQGAISPTNQPGSTSYTYQFGSGSGVTHNPTTTTFIQGSFPANATLNPNDYVNIIVESIQAGDQIQAIRLYTGEYWQPITNT